MTTRQVKRAFKYRFYPSDEQAAELARTFGCVRLVYNKALQARTEAWTQRQERVNYSTTSALLTGWKKTEELAFLNEVSSVPMQQALRHLQVAYTNFFAKRAKYPTFKSKKKSRRSAEYTSSAFRWRDGKLTLAKMVAPLDIVWSRPLPEGAAPSTVSVSQDPSGRWHVSLLCDDVIALTPAVNEAVGVDAGLTALMTLSTGEKITNRSTSAGTGWPWPAHSATWRRKRRAPRTETRPGPRWPASTPGSPTAGAITCTSFRLGLFARTKRS